MVTNPLGKETEYKYDLIGDIKRISQVDGIATASCLATTQSLDYTPNALPGGGTAPEGYIYERTLRNGSVTEYERDERGLILTKTEDANGASPRVTTYTWDATYRLPMTRTTTEMEEIFTYDGDGQITSYAQKDVLSGSPSNGQTRVWTYTYTTNANGLKLLTSVDGPGSVMSGVTDVTSYTYNTDGTLATVTDPNGLVTTYADYDAYGNAATITEPNGVEWTLTYDARGLITEAIKYSNLSSGHSTTFTYDVVGQLTSYTNGKGNTWSFTYDEARRLTEAENPKGETAVYTYDAMGNVTKTEYFDGASALTFSSDAAFDELGRLKTLINAQGTQTFQYDVEDNLHIETDADNEQITNTYDALNRLTSVLDKGSNTTSMGYNDADQVTLYTDARSNATGFTYNGFGDVIQEVSPDRGTISYSYNARGLVSSMVDARGIVTNYAYDDGGRMISKTFPTASAEDQTFTYAPPSAGNSSVGQMTATSDESGATAFSYDNRGRLLHTDTTLDGITYRVSSYFDTRVNELNRILTPDLLQITYPRDTEERITRVTIQRQVVDPNTGALPPGQFVVEDVQYAPFGPLESQNYGYGAAQTRTYDQNYRLTHVLDATSTATLRDWTYSWTTRGNLASVVSNLGDGYSETFDYDPREFLSSADGSYDTLGYSYDAVGNRLSKTLDDGSSVDTDSYSYPATSNRLQSIAGSGGGSRSLSYDAAGNIITDTRDGVVYAYTYNDAGRMASVSKDGVLQAEYVYNADGQLAIRRQIAAGQTFHILYDLHGNRLAEYLYNSSTQSSTLQAEYLWLNGELIGGVVADTLFYGRVDHIGRPVFVTDANDTYVYQASYLPFGTIESASGGPLDYRFPGQWFQSESGLFQNWMRDYDPEMGRYMQADPLGLVDGAAVYNYARQSPMMFVDPRGEKCVVTGYDKYGTARLDCKRPGPPNCPGGDCAFRPDKFNDPEFAQCVSECRATPNMEIFEQCVIAAGLAPGMSGLGVMAVCQISATSIECRKRCDRERGYCVQIDDWWENFPHQFLTPQRGMSVPNYPGQYK